MADITFPTNNALWPSQFEFGLVSNTQIFTNTLTGAIRSRGVPGYRWVARLTWGDLGPEISPQVEALLVQLRGQENRLMLFNLSRSVLRGAGGGTPLVNGAGQTGNTLAIDGLPNSITGVYLKGDMLGCSDMLFMVTVDANSNGSGQTTVTFEPPMWKVPADNAVITVVQPRGRFINTINQVKWLATDVRISQHSLEVAETLST